MNKKITYLLIALALPGLVFVFLKFFGRNQFDIPIYYKDGSPDATKECQTIKGQYFLPDTIVTTIKWNGGAMLLLSGATDQEQAEINRLLKETKWDSLQLISLDALEVQRLKRWKKCALFWKDPWKAVLVDNQKRIRGYYALDSREEIDRLEVELEILLKK